MYFCLPIYSESRLASALILFSHYFGKYLDNIPFFVYVIYMIGARGYHVYVTCYQKQVYFYYGRIYSVVFLFSGIVSTVLSFPKCTYDKCPDMSTHNTI